VGVSYFTQVSRTSRISYFTHFTHPCPASRPVAV